MEKEPEFWLVWCPNGTSSPKYRHPSQKEAEAEARRLARCSGYQVFYVLKAVSRSEKIDVHTHTLRECIGEDALDKDIPF